MAEIIITLKNEETDNDSAIQPTRTGIVAPSRHQKHLARRIKKSDTEIEVYDGAYFLTEDGYRELTHDFEVELFPYTDHGYSCFTFSPEVGAYPSNDNYQEVYDFIDDIPKVELKDKLYKIKKEDLDKYQLTFTNETESTTDTDWNDDDVLKLPDSIANSPNIQLFCQNLNLAFVTVKGTHFLVTLSKITNVLDFNAPSVPFSFSGKMKIFLMPKLYYAFRGSFVGTFVPPVTGLYLQARNLHGSFKVATRRNILDESFEYFGDSIMDNETYFREYFENEFDYELNTIRNKTEFEDYTATANMLGGSYEIVEDEAKSYMSMPNLPVYDSGEPVTARSLELIIQKGEQFYYFWQW